MVIVELEKVVAIEREIVLLYNACEEVICSEDQSLKTILLYPSRFVECFDIVRVSALLQAGLNSCFKGFFKSS